MLDPIVNFFTRVFQWIGRGIGFVIGIILWPFMWAGRWYTQRGWILKAVLGLIVVGIVVPLRLFLLRHPVLDEFRSRLSRGDRCGFGRGASCQQARGRTAHSACTGNDDRNPGDRRRCGDTARRAGATDLQALRDRRNERRSRRFQRQPERLDFIDARVQARVFRHPLGTRPSSTTRPPSSAASIRSCDARPPSWSIRSAARAAHRASIRTCRTRGRRSHGTKTPGTSACAVRPDPTPSFYREAIQKLRAFNSSLEQCQVTFDARADNLLLFLDRIAGDMGSTSDILRGQIEYSNAGWFDPRADDRFWFAYGQLYAYYGILTAARSDFSAMSASAT